MLIDDEPAHLLITEKYLRRAGATRPILPFKDSELALAFLRGTAAVNHATSQTPALVICDVRMPMINGFDILEWVKKQPALRQMPFLLLTSSDDATDITRAETLRADGYLVKFPSIEKFSETLARYLPAP